MRQPLPDPAPALTKRQQRFVEEYAIGGNAAEAARMAGYSENGAKVTGCRLLTNPNLKSAIAYAKEREARKMEVRRDEVIAAINKAFMLAVEQQNPAAMVMAAREIGRLCGFYEPASIRQGDAWLSGREIPEAELLRQLAAQRTYRNPDGSSMNEVEIEAFYGNLSNEELLALAEGKARVETRVVIC